MNGLVPLFSVVFVVMAVLFAPLRMALGWVDADRAGIAATAAEGTVWRGILRGARLGGLSLGDARVGLDPPGLLVLKPGVRLNAEGAMRGEGLVRSSGLADVTATVPLAALTPALPLDGRLELRSLQAEFRKGSCSEAGGDVALGDIHLRGVAVPGLRLAGRAACAGTRLVVPLKGQSGGVAVDADLSVDATGRWRLESRLRATDASVAAAAEAAGFERTLDGFRRLDEGRLGGA